MKPKDPPCLKKVKEKLSYCEITGIFTRKTNHGKRKIGDKMNSLSKFGYIQISVNNKTYTAQRLAWFYVNETWPLEDIDHIDRNKLNNKISNLRILTRSENLKNRPKWKWVNRKTEPRKKYTRKSEI